METLINSNSDDITLPSKHSSTTLSTSHLMRLFHKDPSYRRVLAFIDVNPDVSLTQIKHNMGYKSDHELSLVLNGLVDLGYIQNSNNQFNITPQFKNVVIKNDPTVFGKDFQLSSLKSRMFHILNDLTYGKGHIANTKTLATTQELMFEFYTKFEELVSWLDDESQKVEKEKLTYICDMALAMVNVADNKEVSNEKN